MPTPRAFTFVLSAEHASNRVPKGITLGVGPEVLESHVAWDPGAKEVATHLQDRLQADLIAGEHTRLVADLNRSPWNPEVVPVHAFGVDVPGNAALSDDERFERLERFHTPYWQSVRGAVRSAIGRSGHAVHISVHSFVEEYRGVHRPVDLGLLIDPRFDRTSDLAEALMQSLSRDGELDVRINEPYDGISDGIIPALRSELQEHLYTGIEVEINQRQLGRLDDIAARLEEAFVEFRSKPPPLWVK